MLKITEVCPKPGKFRVPNSCTDYYHCTVHEQFGHLKSNKFRCNYCLKFNAQKGYCDLPKHIPECNLDDGTKRYCTTEGKYVVPKEPHKYYVCKKKGDRYELHVKHCPHKLRFNHLKGECDEIEEEKPKCKKQGLFGDCDICNQYYYCKKENDEFEKYDFTCPKGQIFNDIIKACESEETSVLCRPKYIRSLKIA